MYSFHHIGISNLHYGLYHTLLHLSRAFWNFFAGVWFLWVETKAKTKNRHKLAYPSCLLKKDVEVNSLSLLPEHWFAFSKRPRCSPTFKQCQQTTTGGEAIWLRTIILGSCLSQNVTDSLHINGTIVVPTLLLFILLIKVRSFLHE